jgi:hypothetical protein
MDLTLLKNAWLLAVQANSNFQNDSFRVSEQYDAALNGKDSYPFFHLELPFNISETVNRIEIRYAVTVTDYLKDGLDPFPTLDNSLKLFLQLLKYVRDNNKATFTVENGWTALTITEYSDDSVHGVRVELTSRLLKNYLC